MQIHFLGAAETVTGSRFLLDTGKYRILVDCGLFQGLKKLRLRNREPFPVSPDSINAVILTHAHLDHSGYVPALIKHGFCGKVYCTPATLDLCKILLPDSGYLQEEEAAYANRHKFSKHKPAKPLYTEKDGRTSLKLFESIPFNEEFEPVQGIKIRFSPNGHILGSSSVLVKQKDTRITISGDVGRPNDPIMLAPSNIEDTDYLLVESTYGDRKHSIELPQDVLKVAINSTAQKNGTVIIPAFAVGRAQSILYLLSTLIKNGDIPKLPIYLDSPMAINATELFFRYHDLHRLSEDQCREIFELVTFTRSADQSKELLASRHSKIIISASGMLTGGRVLHHIKHYLPNEDNTIIFVGFQAAGTRGASLLAGCESIKIHGEYIPVKASLVNMENISAHADYTELGEWLSHLTKAPKKTFIVHGEPQSQDTFRLYLKDKFGWEIEVPALNDIFKLN